MALPLAALASLAEGLETASGGLQHREQSVTLHICFVTGTQDDRTAGGSNLPRPAFHPERGTGRGAWHRPDSLKTTSGGLPDTPTPPLCCRNPP